MLSDVRATAQRGEECMLVIKWVLTVTKAAFGELSVHSSDSGQADRINFIVSGSVLCSTQSPCCAAPNKIHSIHQHHDSPTCQQLQEVHCILLLSSPFSSFLPSPLIPSPLFSPLLSSPLLSSPRRTSAVSRDTQDVFSRFVCVCCSAHPSDAIICLGMGAPHGRAVWLEAALKPTDCDHS